MYGINVESVTVVVTAFMLGLGLGSLLGGAISRIRRLPLLMSFALVEVGIGGFGYFSLDLIESVGRATLHAPAAVTAALTFALVLFPTLMMGATLPILTAHLVRHTRNVGRSVGLLYFVNTLGSAAACFAVALFLMRWLGMRGAVQLACVINLAVAAGSFGAAALGARQTAPPPEQAAPTGSPGQSARFRLAIFVVAAVGFVSLSYEILWYRLHSFTTGGRAMAFAAMLGSFLLGIALGSLAARRFCRGEGGTAERAALVHFVLLANAAGFLVAPVSARLASALPAEAYPVLLLPVALAAGLLGAVFPLVCHFGVAPDERAGSGLSVLYLANILGSASGSLLTGFVLMDLLGLAAISQVLAALGALLAAALVFLFGLERRRRVVPLAAAGATVLVAFGGGPVFFDDFYERLQYHRDYEPARRFAAVAENRSGVITVTRDGTVFGGGIYDGVFNTDLVDDANMIVRAFSISAFHDSPRQVLMIGLSSGSWAQVVANHPRVERLTIIEINPGYHELIATHENVRGVLTNPKVEIIIDDGRRWMQRNPDRRFDVIIMNTTFHWRAHASNLLSLEFLALVRTHLQPGGAALYNTTDSPEVQRTACEAFPHVVRMINNVWVSDRPLIPDRERWRDALRDYRIEGRPVLDMSNERHRQRLEQVLGMIDELVKPQPAWYGMESRGSILTRTGGVRVVTDDNMGTEWQIGRR
ncbi:MAG: fused MFS/spermidine synthase [Planctomycetes bacterium]|nr:fused MFS/spermidine synthase [Planctomycetota bacterium]